jgi:DUF2945 family protein
MAESVKRGDTVIWNAGSEGMIEGTVVRKLTKPMEIKGHHVAASPENPQYLVRSSATGALAAHKASALHKATKPR